MAVWPVLMPWPPQITFLQPYPYLAATFQFNVWIKSVASLQTALSFLPLGFPTGLLSLKHPPSTVCGMNRPSLLHGQSNVVSSGAEMLEVPCPHMICG
jgi:hypothetical protein